MESTAEEVWRVNTLDYSTHNEASPYDGWHWKKDPAGILKVGDIIGGMRVLGFCTPCGNELKNLMVYIGYKDKDGNFGSPKNRTTIDYLYLVCKVTREWREGLMRTYAKTGEGAAVVMAEETA
jgi:hypothetical protein